MNQIILLNLKMASKIRLEIEGIWNFDSIEAFLKGWKQFMVC